MFVILDFLVMMSKVKQSKKTDRLDFKKTKILCISKNTIKKIEAQPTEWKKVFESHVSDKFYNTEKRNIYIAPRGMHQLKKIYNRYTLKKEKEI